VERVFYWRGQGWFASCESGVAFGRRQPIWVRV